jgi:4-deoxy-L-threo-5-hexosulose-uronate ketol-isomerase
MEVITIIKLEIINAQGSVLFEQICRGLENKINAVYNGEYNEGDKIVVSAPDAEYLAVKFDDYLKESIIFKDTNKFEYPIPFGALKAGYDPEAFSGNVHNISVYEPDDEIKYGNRLISLNSHDLRGKKHIFPHAWANLVTREDVCFYERNAIDGIIENTNHGGYPYHSWAAGAREDIEYYIDFGTDVEVEKIVFYLRADFPHDTYWKNIDVEFSDLTTATASFEATADGQALILDEKKTTRTIHLTNFKQAVYPFSWAALSQIEVYGNYIKEDLSKMEIRCASNPKDVKHYTTDRLREEFHISKLFTKDNIRMVYSHIDRIITAGIMPVMQELRLEGGKELASDYFLERREMGCINVGGKGIVCVDGTEYEMNPRDGMYIGMGNKEIVFKCVDIENPPKFYVSSCPAHASYPIVKIDISKAKKVPCGSAEDCNKRVINQYIHPEVIKSCQLAMGLTQLEPGSNWNTMPCHTHDRRMEVYMYLDMDENDAVFHMMGEPNETRHIIMRNEEAVISPSWSIHSGVGTKAYSFIWAMCGENQEFTDMDHIETRDLR